MLFVRSRAVAIAGGNRLASAVRPGASTGQVVSAHRQASVLSARPAVIKRQLAHHPAPPVPPEAIAPAPERPAPGTASPGEACSPQSSMRHHAVRVCSPIGFSLKLIRCYLLARLDKSRRRPARHRASTAMPAATVAAPAGTPATPPPVSALSARRGGTWHLLGHQVAPLAPREATAAAKEGRPPASASPGEAMMHHSSPIGFS